MHSTNTLTVNLLSLLMLFFPLFTWAQFDLSGAADLTLENGQQKQLTYSFRYFRQEGNYHFVAGEQKLVVPSVPQKYSIALILQDNKDVWVPDFSKMPVQGFHFSIGGNTIVLRRDPAVTEAPGNFTLQLNDEIFYFNRGPGQINFYFSEEGIKEVKIEGMLKPRK